MLFGDVPIEDAADAILAHSLRVGAQRFRKGRVLSVQDIETMRQAGYRSVVVARLEAGDVGEDEAARRIAALAAGSGVRVGAAFAGRANLYSHVHGLALIDAAQTAALNALDESITLATVAPYARVAPRQMLATVKIIPFAAPGVEVERAEYLLTNTPLLRVAAFKPHRVALISTSLPGMKTALLDKNLSALEARVHALGSELALERRVAHETRALSEALREAHAAKMDPILVFGASAITDRRDVVPAAIEDARGTVEHFGMPVDPGNLLLIGRLEDARVIGLPGCARSPKLNGFDFVLWRLLAGLPVGRAEIAAMGLGGLLSEIASRPQPREEHSLAQRAPKIAAVVLAAGLSSRMGSNKLLAELRGKPLLRHAVEAAANSAADPVMVVIGHEAGKIEAALAGLRAVPIRNPDYANGLSTSLKTGIAAVPDDCDGAIVLLGDMPGVSAALIDRMIAAFDPAEGRPICAAARRGKRGNPVLWARRFFFEIMALQGDVGAKHLMARNDDLVCDVEADDDGPLTDIDTPEALATARAQ
ncbi:MAG: molybdopterin-binding/glycosyltransferase family 2 protein [Rhizomicrobium sp.]